MKVSISKYLCSSKSLMKALISKLSEEFSYVSILGTDTIGKDYFAQRTGEGLNDSQWNERGFVVRVHNGINYSEFSFNDLSEENLSITIDTIRSSVRNQINKLRQEQVNYNCYAVVEEESVEKSFYGEVKLLPTEINSKEKLARLTKMMKHGLQASEHIVDFRVRYSEVHVSKIFISNKKALEQSYIWSQGYLIPIVRKENNTKYAFSGFSGLKAVELLDEMEAAVESVIQEVVELLDAAKIEPGEYDIICSPEISGLIAHEAFGHGVEMDMFVKDRAKAVEYLGKSIASPLVTMRDGATSAVNTSSYLFDDEGTIGSDTVIIKDGILQEGISQILSAMKLGTNPTGNGKRQSFERKAYARMTNTFFEPGKDKLEDMIASIDYGYLVDGTMSGMEDPKNWGIQCMMLKGLEIKSGKLTGKIVSPVIMTGYVPDLLKSISMVSGDFKLFGTGACGKGYKEMVKVSDGGPYIKAKARLG